MRTTYRRIRAIACMAAALCASCQPGPESTRSESVEAWMELEALLTEMRETIVDEAEAPVEVTDGIEYLLVGLRSAIDSQLA